VVQVQDVDVRASPMAGVPALVVLAGRFRERVEQGVLDCLVLVARRMADDDRPVWHFNDAA
jgi:hypothetical protein